MTQTEIARAVSSATGEDLAEIRRRGFSLADPFDVNFDPEPDDVATQIIDWDDAGLGQPFPVAVSLADLFACEAD
ncbi:hypothetical protein M4951_06060 [Blastopirellula sp. J2-11]|uniref:hypothetical protein n=1 Tax=Blastopirellula sp. J2-11 TaxID=2943192 RepID=UPI0021C5B284|nr:hypothetical protein [Blastopirellula sp. J2-11]UUO07875.1 hypothetical protein M4951_06060 [Blastopirellula sp. J2-11]